MPQFNVHGGNRELKWQSHIHGEGSAEKKTVKDAQVMNTLNKSMVAGYPNVQVMRIVPDQPAIVPTFGYAMRQFTEGLPGKSGSRMARAQARQNRMREQMTSNFSKDSNNSSSLVNSFQDLLIPKNVSAPNDSASKSSRYQKGKTSLATLFYS
jgi:hypothetical protein